MSQEKLFNRNFVILCIITLCSGLTAQFMNTALPLYIVNELGSTTTISGVLSSLYTIIACVVRPIGGHLVDRRGRRGFIFIGMMIFAAGCFGFGIWALPAAMLFFRALQGIGFGLSSTASGAAVADNIPQARLGEGLGYLGMCNALPMVVGPSVALFLISVSGYRLPFAYAGALCILALLLAMMTKEDNRVLSEARKKPKQEKFTLSSVFEKTALRPAAVQFFLSIGAACWMVYGSLFAQSRGYGNISLFFVISALGMLIIRFLISKIVDHYNSYHFVIPACILWAVSFAVMLAVDDPFVFLVTGAVYGVCLGVAQTMLNTISYRGVPAQRRGAANATFMIAFDGGIGLGALFLGILIDLCGGSYDVMLVSGIICCSFSAVLSVLFRIQGYGNPDVKQSA